MPKYKNVMEQLVEEQFDQMASSLSCCTCDVCRNDIIAYALNQLPPKYVVTHAGEAYSKTFVLRAQHQADVISAIAQGVNVVRAHPRH